MQLWLDTKLIPEAKGFQACHCAFLHNQIDRNICMRGDEYRLWNGEMMLEKLEDCNYRCGLSCSRRLQQAYLAA